MTPYCRCFSRGILQEEMNGITVAAASGILLVSPGAAKLAALLKDDEVSSLIMPDEIDSRRDA